jgi:hypothetical protein
MDHPSPSVRAGEAESRALRNTFSGDSLSPIFCSCSREL